MSLLHASMQGLTTERSQSYWKARRELHTYLAHHFASNGTVHRPVQVTMEAIPNIFLKRWHYFPSTRSKVVHTHVGR